ncbi:hypothetical protein [Nitrosomonas communis]|uniref:Uncharacterized protein n=1 Tax=Nitrosomonas communis TaxID=44574 RepID=A0A1I4UVH6_9PROT|nr:hypothetical protein [Nitrosomonas communis]SFM92885.1 hypothetical protein SAMN05421863_107114 [Nitrosomonas communis]
MAIITDLTYEQALEYPEPRDILVDESGIYVLTEEHITPRLNPVPQEINADQARLALLEAGLLDVVNQYIAQSNDDELKIRWEYGGKLLRNSPYIASAAVALGLTDAQLDELFIRAAQK